jgi:asparagine synthase (glutamine-hydrolysing)
MCGIAGYVGKTPLDLSRKEKLLDKMKRRGPNHQAFKDFLHRDKIFTTLCHSRLSIIDLHERAQQPYKFGDKYITFNGEIYNYLEIAQELKNKGYIFTTESDTEVLVTAINHWGIEAALDRLDGMWAFALYDIKDGTLTLSRDRFGEKPLYFYQDANNGHFYFASEIKFIHQLLGRTLSINIDYMKKFLINGHKFLYENTDDFFQGLRRVEPGHILRFNLDDQQNIRLAPYWKIRAPSSPKTHDKAGKMSLQDAITGTRDYLIKSVEQQLRGDVKVGFCMSGGVDCNSLIAIAKNILNHDVSAFSVLGNDAKYDEQGAIDALVKKLNIHHHPIFLNKENFLSDFHNIIKENDMPIYTITHYLQWILARAFHENDHKISISGVGADEIFTGYYHHHNVYFASLKTMVDNGDIPQHELKNAIENWRLKIAPFVRNPYLQDPNIFINNPNNTDYITLNSDIFNQYFHDPISSQIQRESHKSDNLKNKLLHEIFVENIPVMLRCNDAAFMYHSVENRAPFLNRSLLEFTLNIPEEYFIQNGATKYILREAMRTIVPDMVLDNYEKIGFNASVEDLLDLQAPDTQNILLGDSPIWDILKKERIKAHLTQQSLPNSMSKFLCSFIACKFFMDENA